MIYKQIITGDESWIYAYDLETTDQSSEYRLKGEAKPKRPKSFENQGDWANKSWILHHDNVAHCPDSS